MKLRLLCVGRLAEAFLREGAAEYAARVERYLPLEIVELREAKAGKKADPRRLRRQEGEQLLAKIPPEAFVVLLDERGKSMSSEDLAALLDRFMVQGAREADFVIGGPFGLDETLRKRADLTLSLSALTFTHQMARVLLLEQLYRALTILRNEPYHHR